MKKSIFFLCILVLLCGLVCGCQKAEQTNSFVQIGNPIMEVTSADEMTDYLKFTIPTLDKEVAVYIVITEGNAPSIGEIRYADGCEFRMKQGNGDISGIYGGTLTGTETIAGINVSFYQYEHLTYALWESDGFSFSYIFSGDATAEIEGLIQKVK